MMLRAKLKVHRTRGVLLAFAAAVLGMVAATAAVPAATAAPISGGITGVVSTAPDPIGQYDPVAFDCTWAVPDGSKPGDTFDMQLPSQLAWQGATVFNLTAPDGLTVATADVDSNGHVVFTLSGYVLTHPNNVHGTCSFEAKYLETVTDAGSKDLTFELNGVVVDVPVELGEPCETDCYGEIPTEPQKWMGWYDEEQTELYSVIDLPALAEDAASVSITDTPQAGSEIDCDRVVPAVGVYDNVEDLIPSGPGTTSEQYPPVVDCTPQRVTVTWTDIPAGNALEVGLWAKLTDLTVTEYQNDATITVNGVDLPPLSAVVQSSRASGTGTGELPSPLTPPALATPSAPATPLAPTAPVAAPPAPSSADASASEGSGLANTGAAAGLPLGVAAITLLFGAGLAIASRRKRALAAR